MIRTSLQDGKQVISKLALRRETVRTLGGSELAAIAGGHEPNCPAETQQVSTCSAVQNAEAAPIVPK